MKKLIFGLLALGLMACTSQPETNPAAPSAPASESVEQQPAAPASNLYEIETRLGTMTIRLYDETPRHRDNFKKLVEDGFYNGTTFHRVIQGFMVQGGDPNSKDDDLMNDGSGGPGYRIPAEFVPQYFHKRGAIAAARQGDAVNPNRESSGSQFYIVHGGNPSSDEDLDQLQRHMRDQNSDPNENRNPGFTFSDEARAAYKADGGTPFLDGSYTIFGEVVDGFDVLDAIATTNTARKLQESAHPALRDQPKEKIVMTVRAVQN